MPLPRRYRSPKASLRKEPHAYPNAGALAVLHVVTVVPFVLEARTAGEYGHFGTHQPLVFDHQNGRVGVADRGKGTDGEIDRVLDALRERTA